MTGCSRKYEECYGDSFTFSKRVSSKILAFAASDLPMSSNEVANPERNGMGKTLMVTV